MVLTCSPCSEATPAGNKRGTAAATRHLDAETNCAGTELILACSLSVADESATDAAATISKQHGGTVSSARATSRITGLVSRSAANGWTSAPTAKNRAAGAMTAASRTGDFRRSLANECRPTESTVYQIVTFAARVTDPMRDTGLSAQVVSASTRENGSCQRAPSRQASPDPPVHAGRTVPPGRDTIKQAGQI